MTEERTFPNDPASVPRARRYARQVLTGVAADLADAVAVMVSELATNSVRHTATEFTVSIDRGPQEIRVAVTDVGDQQPTLRSPRLTEPSGRGLQIVTALADDWGVVEMVDRPGKTVWFNVAVRPGRPCVVQHESAGRRCPSPTIPTAVPGPGCRPALLRNGPIVANRRQPFVETA